jgi:hypothetical protein
MDNRVDIKPRLICCPEFVIRARIGMISYYVLKFMKKIFPEFMLAKTFDQILEDY